MANRRYDRCGKLAATAGINWVAGDMKVALLIAAYSFDATAHQFVTDLGANIVARSLNLTGKTDVAGILKSDAASFPALTGARCLYAVVFVDTGSDATSSLLYYIDTATNLPGTPIGIDVTCQFDPSTGDLRV